MMKIWMRCENDIPLKTLCHFPSLLPPTRWTHIWTCLLFTACIYWPLDFMWMCYFSVLKSLDLWLFGWLVTAFQRWLMSFQSIDLCIFLVFVMLLLYRFCNKFNFNEHGSFNYAGFLFMWLFLFRSSYVYSTNITQYSVHSRHLIHVCWIDE